MRISNQEYAKKVQKISPKSRKIRDIFAAFLVGGIICSIGEIFYYAFTLQCGEILRLLAGKAAQQAVFYIL